MTETIKMLSTENVALREENDNLITLKEEGMLASQGISRILDSYFLFKSYVPIEMLLNETENLPIETK